VSAGGGLRASATGGSFTRKKKEKKGRSEFLFVVDCHPVQHVVCGHAPLLAVMYNLFLNAFLGLLLHSSSRAWKIQYDGEGERKVRSQISW
jgi:hypothetical protein